jgi:hypothetical protein
MPESWRGSVHRIDGLGIRLECITDLRVGLAFASDVSAARCLFASVRHNTGLVDSPRWAGWCRLTIREIGSDRLLGRCSNVEVELLSQRRVVPSARIRLHI